MATGFVRSATHQGFFGFDLQIERVQHPHGFNDDFFADAVTWQDCDFHVASMRNRPLRTRLPA